MSFRSVRIVARFYNSSTTPVTRFLYSPLTFSCFSSVCVDSPSELAQKNASRSAMDSVVKIFSFSREPNVVQPWQTTEKEYSGSGFAISGRRILTNAQLVNDHSYVQVRKHGSPTKYKAKVEVCGYECDLAVLVIDSEKFWENMNPLELGGIPFLEEAVSVLGYPVGGDTISVTKGIVSRVEPRIYSHSSIELLSIETDAAINNGNSGGPVLMEDKVVGMASSSSKINHIIPTPVIKHFLSGVEETGQFIGFCSLNISYQSMTNDEIRKHFKMSPKMTGILVNEIHPLSGAHEILKKDDVILAIDGVSIGNDETIPFRKKERIYFDHLVPFKKPGETVLLKVLRRGREHEFNIILRIEQPLIPDQYSFSYYILAGFVFVPLSKPYIVDSDNLCKCSYGKARMNSEQIVIISQVLVNDITTCYSHFKEFQVKKVNGVELLNLKHLSELVEECCAEELRFDLEKGRVIVVNCKSAKEATPLILEHHGIRSAMSKDLKKQGSEFLASS